MIKNKNITESLVIKKFLSIEKAELNIEDFSVIIGSQAVGKSLILKLVYFFKKMRDYLIEFFVFSDQEDVDNFENFIKKKFKEIFIITKNDNETEIIYHSNNIKITIFIEEDIKIKLSTKFIKIIDALKHIKERESQKYVKKERLIEDDNAYGLSLLDKIQFELDNYIDSSLVLFIPSGRSFFATMNQNIWRNTKEEFLKIDEIMKDFGSHYERFKGYWNEWDIEQSIANDILHSNIVIKDNEIYIKSRDNRELGIASGSSGEQEFVPLAIFIDVLLHAGIKPKEVILFIEEPEAHLFPTAQKKVIYNIVKTMNKLKSQRKNKIKCLISTHSPYVMTSFNNLILAGLIEKNQKSEIKEILGDEFFKINSDVNAFYLDKKLIPIMDNKLIDAQKLDEISDVIMDEFENLLDLCNDE